MSEEKKATWFKRLKNSLQKTSSKISDGLSTLLTKKKLDQDVLDTLEEILISADLGVKTAQNLVQNLKRERFNQEVSLEEVKIHLADQIADILSSHSHSLPFFGGQKPHISLIVGVNGSGKTTTIAKLSAGLQQTHQLSIRLAAGDTFRAAAIEQLAVWAERLNIPLVQHPAGSDPASVAFSAIQEAQCANDDLLFIDTAGRLHNKKDLMDELTKIKRVIQKLDPSAPHSCLLILDASTGQNAFAQVRTFMECIQVSGIIMTKLDGTAKGGVIVGLAEEFQLPIYAIGIGETVEDLRIFDAKAFSYALVGVELES